MKPILRSLVETCSVTTTATTGTFKTIRTPGTQMAQCLSVKVAVDSAIQITCTSVYTQAGTYTMFYDNNRRSLITDSPILNQTYTTTDNTLLIDSLADNTNTSSTLSCTWLFNGNAVSH